jgi:hypothetical protein
VTEKVCRFLLLANPRRARFPVAQQIPIAGKPVISGSLILACGILPAT